jgi:hypothetical protein
MPKIPNPANSVWQIYNIGRVIGDINQSFGIDLESNQGALLTTLGTEVLLNRNTIDYGMATTFIYTNATGSYKWFIGTAKTGTGILPILVDSGSGVFIQDALANTVPAEKDVLDMIVHRKNNNNDRLIVARTITSTTGTLDILNSASNNNIWKQNWWGTTLAQGRTLSADLKLCKLKSVLAVADKNLVHSIDANDVVVDTVFSVDTDYTIIGAQNTVDRMWFSYKGSSSTSTGRGMVAEWDGYSQDVNFLHKLDGIPVVGFVINNIPYYVLDNGQIIKYNGFGFSSIEWAVFPIKENHVYFATTDFVSNHLAYVENGVVYINMPSCTNSEKMRAGIWIFNESKKQLYNAYKHRNDNQYGSSYLNVAGAIVNTFDAGKFMVGFSGIKTNQTTAVTDYVISRVGSTAAYSSSYIVTPLIPSNEVEDYFQTIWLKFNKLTGTSPTIIAKYRVTDGLATNGDQYLRVPLTKTITWKTATTFTVSSVSDIAVGNEVEIIGGPNAGACFHIQSIDTDTKTVTIDETPTYATGVNYIGYAIFDDWIKISNNNPITDTSKTYQQMIANSTALATGTYAQFKLEIRGDNVQELRQIVLETKVQTPLNN